MPVMFDCAIESLSDGRMQRVSVRRDRTALRFDEVLRYWQDDAEFRAFFTEQLAASPFAAYRWETPSVTAATVGRTFEFVLLDTPGLDHSPDAAAFADQFQSASTGESVVAFPNLGNDAVLVVPRQSSAAPDSAYAHLAAFLRHAP